AGLFTTQAYGGLALEGIGAGLNKFRFTPNLQLPGYYQVFAWWPASLSNSTATQFEIAHDAGFTVFTLDQTINGGRWNDLGAYPFSTDGTDYVELSDPNGASVVADALRFAYRTDLTPLFVHTTNLPTGVIGAVYSSQLIAGGGTPPYTWTVTGGIPPAGLTLGDSNGVLTGTPAIGGVYDFTVEVADTTGATAEQLVSLAIGSADGFVASDFGHPYVQNPTADGITLIWWSADDSVALLEYGQGAYTQNTLSSPSAVTFDRPEYADQVTRFKHEVALSGLSPGTQYQYRVGGFESSFKTPSSDPLAPLRFVVWADPEAEPGSHGSLGSDAPAGYPMDQNQGIMATVLATSDLDPDLVLIAGDLVQEGGRLDDWDELFRKINDKSPVFYAGIGPLASRIPIQGVPGNHDYYGSGFAQPKSETLAIHNFLVHLANPTNTTATHFVDGSWPSELDPTLRQTQDERYFSFRRGPATFIGIDTNNQSPNESDYDSNWLIAGENDIGGGAAPDWLPGSRQYQWLEEQLQQAERETPFTFVYFHQPPYSSGPHALPPGVDNQSALPTRHLNALFHKYRVSAVLNGHDEAGEMSETRGEPAYGGDPEHLLRYFVLPSAGDGLRSKLSDLLNPQRVFHTSDSAEGRHYGLLLADISAQVDDTWKASFDLAWINPAWANDTNLDPVGGYYSDTDPTAYFEAIKPVQLPIVEDSEDVGEIVSGSFTPVASADSYGGSALRAGLGGDQHFRFTPLIPAAGFYRVDAFWPASPANASAALFAITTAQGIQTRQVNQRVAGGQWNPLGVFELLPGATIELSGAAAVADAIRLEQLPADKPHVAEATLPDAVAGAAYSTQLEVLGGSAPYTWRLIEGELPSGISLASDGILSGSAEKPAITRFTVEVEDGLSNTRRRSFSLLAGGNGTLLIERFDDGEYLDNWSILDEGNTGGAGSAGDESRWSAANGMLIQSSDLHGTLSPDNLGTYALFDPSVGASWSDYRISASIRSMDDDHLGLMARYQNEDNYYRLSWSREESKLVLIKRVNGVVSLLAETDFTYDQGRGYQIEFSLQGADLEAKIDGQSMLTAADAELLQGTVALYSWRNSGAYYDDILVTELIQSNSPPVITDISATPTTILDTESTQLNVIANDPDTGP
ncbi:MAG: metallophosphoesterase, partial [Gammaproteobacteria bacterium]|nr:metallophosphoesterase [Gammaproteobacteria bacterium]